MKKYQEVEAKYSLKNPEEVIRQLESIGTVIKRKNEHQKDTYYTAPNRDFLADEIVSEWLRIRETEGQATLNYKLWLPVGAKIQNQCKEFETEISDVYAAKQILSHLSFAEIAIVDKMRKSWIYEKIEISIDMVENLGAFIELEYMEKIDDNQIDKINKSFVELLSKLHAQVGERDRRGYAYALIKTGKAKAV